jgi:hypothetical protein
MAIASKNSSGRTQDGCPMARMLIACCEGELSDPRPQSDRMFMTSVPALSFIEDDGMM